MRKVIRYGEGILRGQGEGERGKGHGEGSRLPKGRVPHVIREMKKKSMTKRGTIKGALKNGTRRGRGNARLSLHGGGEKRKGAGGKCTSPNKGGPLLEVEGSVQRKTAQKMMAARSVLLDHNRPLQRGGDKLGRREHGA